MDRTGLHIGQVDETVIVHIDGAPTGLVDLEAHIGVLGAVHGEGGNAALITGSGGEGGGAALNAIAPVPYVPVGIIAIGPLVVELDGDFVLIRSRSAGNHHDAVAVIAANNAVGRVGDPIAAGHELIFVDAGLQVQGDRPDAAGLGHLIGRGTPVIHGTGQVDRGSCGALITEGDLIAVDHGAEHSFSHQAQRILTLVIFGGTGLQNQIVAGQIGIGQGKIGSLIAIEVMEQNAHLFAGLGGVLQLQGVQAVFVLLDDLTGPCVSQAGFSAGNPGIGHHAAPTQLVVEVDLDIIIFGVAADAALSVHIAVTGSGDGLSITSTAEGAGVGHHAGCVTLGSGSLLADIIMLAGVGGVAQSQGVIAALGQREVDLHATGDEHLFRLCDTGSGIVQSAGLSRAITIEHIPVGIAGGLDENIAVSIEGSSQLTIHKLVRAQVGTVFLATIVGAIDVTNQIVVHIGDGTAAAGHNAPGALGIIPLTTVDGEAVLIIGGDGQISGLVPFIIPVIGGGAGVHTDENDGSVSAGDGAFIHTVAVGISHAGPGFTIAEEVSSETGIGVFPVGAGLKVQGVTGGSHGDNAHGNHTQNQHSSQNQSENADEILFHTCSPLQRI